MSLTKNRIISLAAMALVLSMGSSTWAAGLFLTPRGVRPLARGGAYVAGADDVNALSYNPAGIALSQNEILLDFGLPFHFTDFTRADTNGDGMPESSVEGVGLGLPSPTLGLTADLD